MTLKLGQIFLPSMDLLAHQQVGSALAAEAGAPSRRGRITHCCHRAVRIDTKKRLSIHAERHGAGGFGV
jgi:hypothetical protein